MQIDEYMVYKYVSYIYTYIYICTSYILRIWRVQCFNPFNTHDGQDLPQKKQSAFFSRRVSFGRGGLGVTQYDPLKFPNMAIFCEWGARFWDVSTHFCGVVKDHR